MQTTYPTLIIDDEEDGRETLRIFVEKYCPQLEVIGTANSKAMAEPMITEKRPQLIFLDIEMPGGSGFELLESLPERNFETIFITAYDQYAVQAFRVSAVDYLMKPVDITELKAAVVAACKRIEEKDNFNRFDLLLENVRATKKTDIKVAFPTGQGLRFIPVKEIVNCQSESNYTHVFLKDGDKLLLSKTIKWVEELLSPYNFYRVHQSHLVNLNEIHEYVKSDGGYLKMTNQKQLPISSRKREEFQRLMGL